MALRVAKRVSPANHLAVFDETSEGLDKDIGLRYNHTSYSIDSVERFTSEIHGRDSGTWDLLVIPPFPNTFRNTDVSSICKMSRPRENLEGIKLDDGWTVGQRLIVRGASRGIFSAGYQVKNEQGRTAFLKAIDFYEAGFQPDPARALEPLIETFNFERDVLAMCKDKNLDRVVRYITDGKVMLNGHAVQYLILELADRDIRGQIDLLRRVDLAWQLRALHHIATVIKQLHGLRIAHQDLKPANVLVFGDTVKVGDLGKASHPDYSPPHDDEDLPGDRSYSPPELLYDHRLPDWKRRRFGADLYLLGSMIVFMFTRASMTALI